MDIFDKENALKTFEVIYDTREQRTSRLHRRLQAMDVPAQRGTLAYGDYTYNILVDGVPIYDLSKTISAQCIVERKMDLDELASCLGRNRERFSREFERARENNARIYLVCEDGSIDMLLAGQYRSKIHPKAFFNSLMAWQVRYDIQIVFCSQVNSGRVIKELLYRDAKERLEQGYFDNGRNEICSNI